MKMGNKFTQRCKSRTPIRLNMNNERRKEEGREERRIEWQYDDEGVIIDGYYL